MTTATLTRSQDQALIELVDALVESIDANRTEAVARVREALESIGAASLFDDEFRLNGVPSCGDGECVCEGWL